MAVGVQTTSLTPELLTYGVTAAVDPQVSPDGMRLVYGLGRGDPKHPEERPKSSLWTSAVDGSGAAPLTEEGHRDGNPRWSPDGTTIAFTTDRLGKPAPVTVPATGGSLTKLAQHDLAINWLAWSPDGASIAYSVTVDPEERTAGPDPLIRVTARLDYKEDVRGYLGDRRTQIFVAPATSGETRRLSTGNEDHWFPTWSPDSRTLAYRVSDRVGMHSWLRLQSVASGEARDVHFADIGSVALYTFSPSGDRVLCTADPGRTSQPDFFLVEAATGALTRLTDDLPVVPDAGYPSSVPPSPMVWLDDRRVLFHGAREGSSNLYTFDVESRELAALTSWEAANVGMSVDAGRTRVVQAHSSLSALGEISVWDRESGETTIVTHNNDGLLEAHPAAKWERIGFERGGLDPRLLAVLPARLRSRPAVPPDPRGPRRAPRPPRVRLPAQGRGAGDARLPGADGQSAGLRYVWPRLRDRRASGLGGEDYLDLQAAVDLVAARDYVDADRVGICGYSYGGFMTSYTIGRTHRYKAAVCGAPCFNLVSMYGTSDITPFWGQIQWGSKPWENPEWYREHSPFDTGPYRGHADAHHPGGGDNRCPIGQGEEMFTALSQAGVDVEFVRYPGASHGFSRLGPTGQREDFLQRHLDWFGSHL